MSLDSVFNRISELNSLLGGAAAAPAQTATAATTAATSSTDAFATMLRSASVTGSTTGTAAGTLTPLGAGAAGTSATTATGTVGPVAAPAGNSPAARMVAMAQAEVGQAEQPPGSNNSPRIAQYRRPPPARRARARGARTSPPGSPAARASRSATTARASARWTRVRVGAEERPRDPGLLGPAAPQPGDLIVWDEHIGIVESVRPDGSIQTIEGNSSDRVSRRVHAKGDAIGYVRLSN